MKKLIKLVMLTAGLFILTNCANAYTVTKVTDVPTNSTAYYNYNEIYNNDLTRIEKYLFDKTYTKENYKNRINRIETKLFNRTYPTMNVGQRMNNILANYTQNYSANSYPVTRTTNYYNPSRIRNRIMNNIIGQPTGFTPPLTAPYINRFGPSYSRGYYGTNGWGYHNSYHPTMTGAGVHILH